MMRSMHPKKLAAITFVAGLVVGTLGSWTLWMQAEPHTAWLIGGMARMEMDKRLGIAERAGDMEEVLYLQHRLVDIEAPSGDRYLRLTDDFYSWSAPAGMPLRG